MTPAEQARGRRLAREMGAAAESLVSDLAKLLDDEALLLATVKAMPRPLTPEGAHALRVSLAEIEARAATIRARASAAGWMDRDEHGGAE